MFRRLTSARRLAAGALLALLASGCGSGLMGNIGGSLTPNFVTGEGAAPAMFTSIRDQAIPLLAPTAADGPFLGLNSVYSLNAGQAMSGGLISLKYFVQNIQLCESVTATGSGYSGTSGCIYIYRNPGISASESSSTTFYDNYTATAALADGAAATRFSDLMTTAGLASLRRPLTIDSSMVGTYNYGMINFMRVVKATASFTGPGGAAYHTQANTSVYRTGMDGSRVMEYVKIGNTVTATAPQEVTYMMNNGGTYFRFNQPFVISDADISSRNDLKIDLVFNPMNFGSVSPAGSDTCTGDPAGLPGGGVDGQGYPNIYDPANCVSVSFPFAKLNPVPRKGTQKTRKEVYRFPAYYSGTTINADVRVELYYNDGDPTKAIQGIDVATELTGTSTGMPPGTAFYAYSSSESGGVVSLKSYDGTDSVTNLTRRTSGTASVACLMVDNMNGTGCATAGTPAPKAYTYAGDSLVSTD